MVRIKSDLLHFISITTSNFGFIQYFLILLTNLIN